MKRFLALAALVLGMVSCQTEPEGLDVIVGGEQEAVINVSLAEATRTSADSGIVNVDNNVYDLRYILEVYDTAGNTCVYRDVQTVATGVKTVSFPVRLIPERDYNFVVWADFVTNDSEDDLYYTTTKGLDEVSIIPSMWVQMEEARDAYTGHEIVTGYNSGKSINITLTRPFGKLRVITTDIDALNKLIGKPMPKSITVNYTNKVYTAFNALTQEPMTEINKSYAYDLANVYEEDWTTENRTLFTDYIFGTESGSIQFTMDVVMTNGNVVSNNFNTEIPVKRNYLTTITGDILTDGNNIKVDVSDGFENAGGTDPDYEYSTISSAADFFAAVEKGGEYIVISNITISNAPTTLAATRATTNEPTEPTTTTIDLNGYTITVENNTGAALVTLTDGDTLVFEDNAGNGKIILTDDSNAGFIKAQDGCVVIEGGEVTSENANVDVVDGNFFEVESNEDSLALLQYICDNGGTFTFTRDIEGNVTVVQKEGVKVNIDGNGHKFNGYFRVHSNSEHYTDAALTIKNLNFVTAKVFYDKNNDPYFNFIEALDNGNGERYSTNITVYNCTFTATGVAEYETVGLQIKSSKWAKAEKCTANGLHSLVQAQSCDTTVDVIDCTIKGKNGVAFKQVKAAKVEGTTIEASGYGIRFDGNTDNYGIVVKDNKISAAQPFIVRKMTGKNNTIALEGTNTLTTDATYQIVITNGSDDAAYAIPTGTYTLTGAGSFSVFPDNIIVATAEDLHACAINGYNVNMADHILAPLANRAIYGTPVAVIQKGGTINGNGYSLNIEKPVYEGYAIETWGGTIKNLVIDSTVGRGIIISSPTANVYIDNVTVDGPGYAINTTEHNGKELHVTNSTVKGWTSLAGLTSASFTKCTFGLNTSSYWQNFGYGIDYDRLLRPYISTTLTECNFEQGYYLDLSNLSANCMVTVKDCVCDGTTITADNYSEYITIELPSGRALEDCVIFE